MGAELKNCETASGPREAILVKGKMKNQRKLINTEETTPREKRIGHLLGRESSVLNREACYCSWFSQNLCVSSSISPLPTQSYHIPIPPSLSWGGLSWSLLPDQAAITPLLLWDAFISTQGSGDGGDPSLQYSFCRDLDLPHQISPS